MFRQNNYGTLSQMNNVLNIEVLGSKGLERKFNLGPGTGEGFPERPGLPPELPRDMPFDYETPKHEIEIWPPGTTIIDINRPFRPEYEITIIDIPNQRPN